MAEFQSGQVIAEHYKVLSLLGSGGMGAVYLVEDSRDSNKYALKTILATDASDRNLQRFKRESEATSRLNHPNLVRIFDSGFISDGQPYFVMEFIEGKDLSTVMKEEGALPLDRVLEHFITICNAITYAHAQGVVHRDLKPSNVMIADGVIKILDFGIAKIFSDATQFNTVTRSGEVIGSPSYMSPEQCLGRPVDLRSDVYSIGCMLYECLVGAPPFIGETALATMLKHQSEKPLSLKEASLGGSFPADLEIIISRMLEKDANNRYSDLLQVAEDLKCVQRKEPISRQERPVIARTAHKGWWIAAAALTAISAFIVFSISHPTADQSYNRQFGPQPEVVEPKLEQVKEAMSGKREFYSVLKSSSDKKRDFHFPDLSIGDFGQGKTVENFTPARGLQRDVEIPFGLNIAQDANSISGFRNDEIAYLSLKGYLVDDSVVATIKDWQQLSNLNMDDTAITDGAIDYLKGLKKLQALSINDTAITGKGLLNLNLQQLSYLNANRVKDVRVILPRLDKNQIATLSLNSDNLTDDDLKTISSFSKLHSLSLSGNTVSDKGIENLTTLKKLELLWVDATNLTPKSVSLFRKLNLVYLSLDNCFWLPAEKKIFRNSMRRGNKTLVGLDMRPSGERKAQ